MGHKLDKVGGKAKKSLSSLKLNKDKKNLDSVPEGRELGGLGRAKCGIVGTVRRQYTICM